MEVHFLSGQKHSFPVPLVCRILGLERGGAVDRGEDISSRVVREGVSGGERQGCWDRFRGFQGRFYSHTSSKRCCLESASLAAGVPRDRQVACREGATSRQSALAPRGQQCLGEVQSQLGGESGRFFRAPVLELAPGHAHCREFSVRETGARHRITFPLVACLGQSGFSSLPHSAPNCCSVFAAPVFFNSEAAQEAAQRT